MLTVAVPVLGARRSTLSQQAVRHAGGLGGGEYSIPSELLSLQSLCREDGVQPASYPEVTTEQVRSPVTPGWQANTPAANTQAPRISLSAATSPSNPDKNQHHHDRSRSVLAYVPHK